MPHLRMLHLFVGVLVLRCELACLCGCFFIVWVPLSVNGCVNYWISYVAQLGVYYLCDFVLVVYGAALLVNSFSVNLMGCLCLLFCGAPGSLFLGPHGVVA